MLLIPFFGVFMYLIVRGHKMQEHSVQAAKEQDEAFRAQVREAASDGSTTEQLAKLADLRDRGAISPQEFDQEKAKLLA